MKEKGGSIGKKYRRCDAIGIKYCVTCDFDTFDPNKNDLDTID